MSNIVSFDEYSDVQQIAAHQLGLPRVILEGRSDLKLFKEYWFKKQCESVEFLCANDLGCGDGCTAVERAVAVSRDRDRIPAYGIVDRDRLFRDREWSALFAVNDQEFNELTGEKKDVYTTMLWEIEAYLLEPELLPQLAEGHCTAGFTASHGPTSPLDIALVELEHMLKAQRLFAAAHECEKGFNDKHFLGCDGAELHDACNLELSRLDRGHERAAAFDKWIDRISEAAPQDPSDRFRFLLRYVNTKRFIHRLVHKLRLYPDIRGFLATMMAQADRQPAELSQQLDKIKRSFS